MAKATRIIQVVHHDGDAAYAGPRRPRSTLFEITEGPHRGKRGADADLHDLVGAIDWDPGRVSIYETGEHIEAPACTIR